MVQEKKFKIYARAIIVNKNNDILLLKKHISQKLGGGDWLLPGGTLEFGENIDDSLVREIKEETNLDVEYLEILSHKKMMIEYTHRFGVYFICRVKDATIVANMEPKKHETVGFFSSQELPNMKDAEMINFFLEKFGG